MIFLMFVTAFLTLACVVVPLTILAAFALGRRERKGEDTTAGRGAAPGPRPAPVRGSRERETVVT